MNGVESTQNKRTCAVLGSFSGRMGDDIQSVRCY